MRTVCFAGAATVAVSTPDSPMARISQCVYIGCGRPQGEAAAKHNSKSRKPINNRNIYMA